MLVLFCSTIVGCKKTYQKGETYQKDIDEIHIHHSESGQRVPEFKIDLKNKKFWKYTSELGPNYVERNVSSDNEGYNFVCDLNDEIIADFLRKSARYGLTLWEESYVNENVEDGHQWGITVLFSDSTTFNVYGSNKYPEPWDEMRDAFIILTGEDILLIESDWLDK